MGLRLYFLSRGEDFRRVSTDEESKSISAETTFDDDIADPTRLESVLWTLAEKVARRAKSQHFSGYTITLKLKTKNFETRTRSATLEDPTQLAHRIFEVSKPLLQREANGTDYRLIGVGISNLEAAPGDAAKPSLDETQNKRDKAEAAIDKIRSKFGIPAVVKGIALREKKPRPK